MFKSYVRQILEIVFKSEFHDQRQLARIRMRDQSYLDELREINADRERSLKMEGVRVNLQKANVGWKIREIK